MAKSLANTVDHALKTINSERLNSLTSAVDHATIAINSEMLKTIKSTLTNSPSITFDPKLFENMINLPISNFSRLVAPTFDIPSSNTYAQLSYEEQQEYNKKSLALLEEIRKNTTNLSTIVDLIMENNTNQEQILLIINEIFALAAAKNEEELKDKFMKVIKNINSGMEFSVQAAKLIHMATTVFFMVSPLISNIGK